METTQEAEQAVRSKVPEYVPARMLNEFVYCPRLFYYEWVDGLFQESVDTLEGKFQHKRVDEKATGLAGPEDLGDEPSRSRSVTMSSDRYGIIARMDLVEADGGMVRPVDYKHGNPRTNSEGIELWPADKIQLAAQGLILGDNGYRCDEGLVFYLKTRQRVRVQFDESLISETVRVIAEARATAGCGRIPAPLEDSPKCHGCSLVGICLPDETIRLSRAEGSPKRVQLSLFDGIGSGGGCAEPAPERKRQSTWHTFLKAHWEVLASIDFTTIEVWTKKGLVTYYLLFFMERATRRVHFAGFTDQTDEGWLLQAARNVTDAEGGFLGGKRYLLMDRDGKFSEAFRGTLEAVGVKPVRLPARSPNLNSHIERFMRSLKEQCLGRMIFFGEQSLQAAISSHIEHYHAERNHQGMGNRLLISGREVGEKAGKVVCRERLGGLPRYYYRQAA